MGAQLRAHETPRTIAALYRTERFKGAFSCHPIMPMWNLKYLKQPLRIFSSLAKEVTMEMIDAK